MRLTNTVSPAGTFAYQYLTATFTQPSGISLPNGAGIANNYDALARFTGTALTNHWGHVLDGYAYQTDPLGLQTNIVRNLGLSQSTVNVGYDGIGQLTSWSAAESSGTPRWNEQLGFGYDPAHNLHSRTNGGLAQTFTTDAANQLNTVARTSVSVPWVPSHPIKPNPTSLVPLHWQAEHRQLRQVGVGYGIEIVHPARSDQIQPVAPTRRPSIASPASDSGFPINPFIHPLPGPSISQYHPVTPPDHASHHQSCPIRSNPT